MSWETFGTETYWLTSVYMGLGVPGSQVNNTGLIYSNLTLPGDNNNEYRVNITSVPGGGNLTIQENTNFSYTGPSGAIEYDLYENGQLVGSFQFNILNKITKYWTGSAWEACVIKTWNGSAWVLGEIKIFNGNWE